MSNANSTLCDNWQSTGENKGVVKPATWMTFTRQWETISLKDDRSPTKVLLKQLHEDIEKRMTKRETKAAGRMHSIGCALRWRRRQVETEKGRAKRDAAILKDFFLQVSFDLQLLIVILLRKFHASAVFDVHSAFYVCLAQTLSYSTSWKGIKGLSLDTQRTVGAVNRRASQSHFEVAWGKVFFVCFGAIFLCLSFVVKQSLLFSSSHSRRWWEKIAQSLIWKKPVKREKKEEEN